MQFRDWTWYHLLPYENCLPFRGFTLFAEQGYNPIVTYSLTVVNRNITERDEKMDELLEKNAEKIMLITTTLLADCLEKLSKEINPAQSTYITAKIATCLEILKLFH